MNEINLSIVIPAYQEQDRIAGSLQAIADFMAGRGQSWELLVVDDGSMDRTSEVARESGIQELVVHTLPCNLGKGGAVKYGILASRGSRILITDADLSSPIAEIVKLEAALERSSIAIGSRAVHGSDIRERQPFYRQFLGKTFNRIVALLAVRGIRDTQCGFKLLDGDTGRELFSLVTTDGFAFDVELLWLASMKGIPVAEIGVEWSHVEASRVRLFIDPILMLRDVLRFRWHHRKLRRQSGRPEQAS